MSTHLNIKTRQQLVFVQVDVFGKHVHCGGGVSVVFIKIYDTVVELILPRTVCEAQISCERFQCAP